MEVAMAEASVSTERKPGTQGGASRSEVVRQEGPLQTERGQTTIADAVVTKVASMAAREVRGVHDLGGGVSRAIGSVTQRVGVGDERTQGVSVEVGEREAAVDVTLVIEYGESIPRVSQAVRDNVIKRIEGITGLSVTEVNVSVNDLYFPGDEVPEQPRVQ
ncbi:MAG: Asp23/Gls24 family envelope stress response protein [Solirubrobacterales bacterium]|nr:Asp23/Gls24 family envelope stress response protein [Solirubrobacterales bacterium]MBV9944823.1 Asp23/Gls24 family envelope stress response protein [Solirubrobacterales bacterium]